MLILLFLLLPPFLPDSGCILLEKLVIVCLCYSYCLLLFPGPLLTESLTLCLNPACLLSPLFRALGFVLRPLPNNSLNPLARKTSQETCLLHLCRTGTLVVGTQNRKTMLSMFIQIIILWIKAMIPSCIKALIPLWIKSLFVSWLFNGFNIKEIIIYSLLGILFSWNIYPHTILWRNNHLVID